MPRRRVAGSRRRAALGRPSADARGTEVGGLLPPGSHCALAGAKRPVGAGLRAGLLVAGLVPGTGPGTGCRAATGPGSAARFAHRCPLQGTAETRVAGLRTADATAGAARRRTVRRPGPPADARRRADAAPLRRPGPHTRALDSSDRRRSEERRV